MKFSKLALVALSTAAGIRTSGAVTSAPSPAALSFTPFGSGLCADDQNRVFSHIELRQPSIATAAVCSNFCFTNFDHPDLVGFGIDNPDQHCVCYYSGGDVPSFFPPKGSTYVRIVEPGRGPIMSTSIFSQSYDCYVYAKGTGSPTTPGATKAPSTPVPTGTLTAAPTPVGIASHTKIGDGLCQDSAGDLYSFVEFNGNPLSSNDCAQTCGQLPSQDLVGFYFGTLGPTCRCYYSAKNVPAPPLGLDWAIIGTTDKGSGPIKNASTLFGECYAFAQGTGNPTASPTKSPVARPSISPSASPSVSPSASGAVTSAPSPAALSYNLFGIGVCADDQHQNFSYLLLRNSINTAAACSTLCSTNFNHPDLVGFGLYTPTDACLCYYSGGDVPSFSPPNNIRYVRSVYPGQGPIMTTSGSTYDCYVYVQRTGSPTTTGATKAPSTPVPTGTLTAAPTPIGLASHLKIGDGICQDSAGDYYSYIDYLSNPASSNDCAQTCSQLPSQDLVGFTWRTTGATSCGCYYSAKNIPTPPLGIDWTIIETGLIYGGTGPIKNTDNRSGYECYAFAQGIETKSPSLSPSTSPTASPSATPSKSPTNSPSLSPSTSPTASPSATPSKSPTKTPSLSPSTSPSVSPSATPSKSPTTSPILSPSTSPTASPSANPSKSPTKTPSLSPSTSPTVSPSATPSKSPTKSPSLSPSVAPSESPSATPSKSPTTSPILSPSVSPSASPSAPPSKSPTNSPATSPTATPISAAPTDAPVPFCGAFMGSPCTGPTDFSCLCAGLNCVASNSSPSQFECSDLDDATSPTNPPTNPPTNVASKSGKMSKNAKVTPSPSTAKSNKSTKKVFQD